MPGNLYEQVRIAYAMPREIAIITVGNGINFNMFPTDLPEHVGVGWFIGSLRSAGKASKQVQLFKRICISSINPEWHNRAYDFRGKTTCGNYTLYLLMMFIKDILTFQTTLACCNYELPRVDIKRASRCGYS